MLLGVMKNLPGVGHVEQVSPNGGIITDGSNSCTVGCTIRTPSLKDSALWEHDALLTHL